MVDAFYLDSSGKNKADLVILYSGGADSRLLLEFAREMRRTPICVLINYEQVHRKELEYAVKHLKEKCISHKIVDLLNLGLNSGLTGVAVPGLYEGVSPMNVPARNTMFISIAYAVAENHGITEIWYGADYSDRENQFPDCYQEYVHAMNKVLEVAPVRPIKLRAPLLGWSKEMVLEYLEHNCGIKKGDVYSGYEDPEEDSAGPDPRTVL